MNTTVPYFNNYQIRTLALGIAYRESSDEIYYISTVGPTISLKSLWATLVANKKRIVCQPWVYYELLGKRPLKSFYQPLPQTSYTHLIACTDTPELLIVTDADAIGADDVTRANLLMAHHQEISGKFTAILNTITDAPVLPEWGGVIWNDIQYDTSAITPLVTQGDCLGAWLINTGFNWKQLLSDYLQQQLITIPDIQQ